MNGKIKNYVDLLFEGVPRSQKAIELRNEILSNLNDKFEAFLKEGKPEHEAYGFAIAELGEVDELIKTVLPNKEIIEKIDKERKRRGLITAFSIGAYICAPAVLIFLSTFGYDTAGVVALLTISAVATSALVYSGMSTPTEVIPYFKNSTKFRDKNDYVPNKDDVSNKDYFFYSLQKFYWLLITVIYLAVSFLTHAWHISWLIFMSGAAIWQGIKLIIIFFNDKKENIR